MQASELRHGPSFAFRRAGIAAIAVAGALDTYGYIRLIVGSDRSAQGQFINSEVSFMPSREDPREPIGPLMRIAHRRKQAMQGRTSRIDPTQLDDASFRWTAQLFVPATRIATLTEDHASGRWFISPDGSWAVVETSHDGDVLVYEGGPQPIWTRIEDAARWWDHHDQPTIDQFSLHVTTESNTYSVSSAETIWNQTSSRR